MEETAWYHKFPAGDSNDSNEIMKDVSNPNISPTSGYFASSTAKKILEDSIKNSDCSKTDDPSFMMMEQKLEQRCKDNGVV